MDLSEGSRRKWVQRPDSAVYIFSRDLKVAMYPSSPASHYCPPPRPSSLLPPPSFALLASATPAVSGQISPTVGSAGLCGGLFILERGLPSGSLHLSKHPPAAALCSRPCTAPPHPPHSFFSCSSTHLISTRPTLHNPFLFYQCFTAGLLIVMSSHSQV